MKKIYLSIIASSVFMLLAFCMMGCSSNTGEQTATTESGLQSKTVYVIKERSTLNNNYEYSNPEFDEHGNLIQITETQPDSANETNTITFEYSDNGLLTKRVDSIDYKALYDDYVVTTTYDDHGEVVKVESTNDKVPTEFEVYLTPGDYSNTYNENGQLVERKGNSLTFEYEYNDEGQLIKETTYKGSSKDSTREFIYDEEGNLIRVDVKVGDSSWSNLYTYETEVVEVVD